MILINGLFDLILKPNKDLMRSIYTVSNLNLAGFNLIKRISLTLSTFFNTDSNRVAAGISAEDFNIKSGLLPPAVLVTDCPNLVRRLVATTQCPQLASPHLAQTRIHSSARKPLSRQLGRSHCGVYKEITMSAVRSSPRGEADLISHRSRQ